MAATVRNSSVANGSFRFDHYFVEELFASTMTSETVSVAALSPLPNRQINPHGLSFEEEVLDVGRYLVGAKRPRVRYVKLCNRTGVDVSVRLTFSGSAKVKRGNFYVRSDHTELCLRTKCFVRIPVRFSPKRRGTVRSKLKASFVGSSSDEGEYILPCQVSLRGVGV